MVCPLLAYSWFPTKFKIEIASQCKIRQFLSHVKTNLRAALLSSKKASNCRLQNSQLNLCWFFVHFFFENWLQKMVTVQLSACNLWYKCTEKYFIKTLTPWTNLSWQDEPWAEISTLEGSACIPCTYRAVCQYDLTYSWNLGTNNF